MALQLSYATIVDLRSDDSGDLVTTGHKVRYKLIDSVTLAEAKIGELDLDAIVDTDSVATWWGKVKTQIETAEGIS